MNKQEILNFNKRCAEFLGAKVTDLGGAQKAIYYPILGGSHYAHKLKFHSDWNWIMEVVEAIEKLFDSNIYFKISWNNVVIGIATQYELAYNTGFEGVEIHREINKKEAAIQAINQFLIWYEDFNKE
jgi:hypothetical protein